MNYQRFGISVAVLTLAATFALTHEGSKPASSKGFQRPSATQPPARAILAADYGRLPLAFEANAGQSDRQVKFLARESNYGMFLTRDSAVLLLRKSAASKVPDASRPINSISVPSTHGGQVEDTVVSMKVANANPRSIIYGQNELAGKSNYFIGNDPRKWRTNVPNYAEVKYQSVYPGVDLVYYGNQGKLEYDFVVAPGADPHQIVLDLETESSSAEASSKRAKLHLDSEGNLVIAAAASEVVFQKPVIYQPAGKYEPRTAQKQTIDGKYVLVGTHKVTFQVADYDHSRPLVIDPKLVYSTYLGGKNWDKGNAITVNAAGNAYITGKTTSTDIPITKGAFRALFGAKGVSRSNAYITVLNSTGTGLIYSTYLGGNIADEAYGIVLDASGNAYVTGWTASSNFPTTTGVFQTSPGGGFSDAFVTKLNATGSALIYSTYLGGSSYDEGHGIAVDASGNAYVTGHTFSSNFPTTAGVRQVKIGGYYDAFVTKLNPTGSALLYSTYLGANDYDEASGIAVDASGNAYIAGYTNSYYFPTTHGTLEIISRGGFDAFVSKLNPTASALVYSTYLGGGSDDYAYALTLDPSGNVYVTGRTYSPDFPTTSGAFQTAMGGGSSGGLEDAFVVKLNPAGSALVYSTFVGGSADDAAYSIAVDASGNASIAGDTDSTNFPTTTNALQTTPGGFDDAFVTKLNPAGTALIYSSYMGSSNDESACGIALDAAGDIYVTGWTTSKSFPVTTGVLQTDLTGVQNIFVAEIKTQ